MLFNSYIFILLFLPMALLGYFLCNAKGKYELGKNFLTVMSLWFYAWFNIRYLPIIVGSILVNYMLYRLILGNRGMEERKKSSLYITVAGCAANLAVLFYYKYYDFFLENINAVFQTDFTLQHLLLPLGISFFTFQQVGFLVDTYRGETENYSFMDYALFVTFFPQLIAGPIVTHDEMVGQFADISKKKWNAENFSKGFYGFVCGLAKKVLIADIFGKAVAWGFQDLENIAGITIWWMMLSYMVQLYFDFSGYSDMARGIGLMFNIDIPVNFNSPYKAIHLVDFWKRWHITLNRFFTKYVYIPLGGNRKGQARTCINIFMIYLVSGIWHGAGWTFLLWGILHGFIYVLTRQFLPWIEKLPKPFTWAVNMLFFGFSLVFFRAESIGQALEILHRAIGGGYSLYGIPDGFAEQFCTQEFFYCLKLLHLDTLLSGGVTACHYLLMAGYMIAAWIMLLCCKNVNEKMETFRPTIGRAIFVAVLFLWALVSFSEVSTFLYFNF